MNRVQVPGWHAGNKSRAAARRELQDEIYEALNSGAEARMSPRRESQGEE